MEQISVLGFAGSLRKESYNKALLRAAAELMPKNAKLEIFDIEGIPLYNQDLENDMPAKVKEFKKKIRRADAILIATPEYTYSFPNQVSHAPKSYLRIVITINSCFSARNRLNQ